MGSRGPKPLPANLHLLKGNPSKLNAAQLEAESAAVDVSIPKAPSYIKHNALREWKRLSKVLKKYGLITLLDRSALAAYCIAYSRWVEAEEELERLGIGGMVQTYESGAMAPHPAVGIAKGYHAQMAGYYREFGLTPSARRGLEIMRQEDGDQNPEDDEDNPERFFE